MPFDSRLSSRGSDLPCPDQIEIRSRGTAEQIPWLKFPPPPKQLFCTNCGNAVPEHAAGCRSCGLKPTGHKNFCRQCGGVRNPDPKQVICTQCGADFGSGIIPDPTRIARALNGEAVKKLFIGGVALAVVAGLFWFVFPILFSSIKAPFGGNNNPLTSQLKRAKSGDWAEYEIAFSGNGAPSEREKFKIEVISNDGKRLKLQTTTTQTVREWVSNRGGDRMQRSGGEGEMQEVEKEVKTDAEIDLSKSEEEIMMSLIKGGRPIDIPFIIQKYIDSRVKVEIKKGKTTRETLSVAGQTFNCTCTPYIFSITLDNLTLTIRDIKEWASKAAPISGTVQTEFRMTLPGVNKLETLTVTLRLTGFRKT